MLSIVRKLAKVKSLQTQNLCVKKLEGRIALRPSNFFGPIWGEMSDAVIVRKVADELTWRTVCLYG